MIVILQFIVHNDNACEDEVKNDKSNVSLHLSCNKNDLPNIVHVKVAFPKNFLKEI